MSKSCFGSGTKSQLLLVTAFYALTGLALPAWAQNAFRERVSERLTERLGDKQAVNDSGDPEQLLEDGGLQRSYIVHLPAGYNGKTALPLVIIFHGGGGNAPNAVRMSDMSVKADKEKFIAVYPNGTGLKPDRFLTWNTWVCCGTALDNHIDDVDFVRALIEKLQRDYRVDPKRIYATGLSNGGMMTYRVACELSDLFAAIAPVAGALDTEDCRPAFPVSVIIFHGTADKHVLYEGGVPIESFDRGHTRVDKPVSYAVDFWVKQNRCSAKPAHTQKGNVIHDLYSSGANGTEVELYTIEGHGHAWPGGRNGARYGNVDPPTQEISATDVMWDFFARHPKK